MPLPLPDDIYDLNIDMSPKAYLRFTVMTVDAAVKYFNRYTSSSGKTRMHPDIEAVIMPLLTVQDELAKMTSVSEDVYEHDEIKADDYLKMAHDALADAELYFNHYTVRSGQSRLVPFIADTASAIICAKDDIEYKLGYSDAPDPIHRDHLQTAHDDLDSALRDFNTWAQIDQGLPPDDPAVAVTNGIIVYAMEHVQAFIDKYSDGGD